MNIRHHIRTLFLLALSLFSTLPLLSLPQWLYTAGAYTRSALVNAGKTTFDGVELIGKEIGTAVAQDASSKYVEDKLHTRPVNLPGCRTMLEVDIAHHEEALCILLEMYIKRYYDSNGLDPKNILTAAHGTKDPAKILPLVEQDLDALDGNFYDFNRRFAMYMSKYYEKFSEYKFKEEWDRKKTLQVWCSTQAVGLGARYGLEFFFNSLRAFGGAWFTQSIPQTLAQAYHNTLYINPATRQLTTLGLISAQTGANEFFTLAEDFSESTSQKQLCSLLGSLAQLYIAVTQLNVHDTDFLSDILIAQQVISATQKMVTLGYNVMHSPEQTRAQQHNPKDKEAPVKRRKPFNANA
jgi:hypothetical protein